MKQLCLAIKIVPRVTDIAPHICHPKGAFSRVHLCSQDLCGKCFARMWHVTYYFKRSNKRPVPASQRLCSRCDAVGSKGK